MNGHRHVAGQHGRFNGGTPAAINSPRLRHDSHSKYPLGLRFDEKLVMPSGRSRVTAPSARGQGSLATLISIFFLRLRLR